MVSLINIDIPPEMISNIFWAVALITAAGAGFGLFKMRLAAADAIIKSKEEIIKDKDQILLTREAELNSHANNYEKSKGLFRDSISSLEERLENEIELRQIREQLIEEEILHELSEKEIEIESLNLCQSQNQEKIEQLELDKNELQNVLTNLQRFWSDNIRIYYNSIIIAFTLAERHIAYFEKEESINKIEIKDAVFSAILACFDDPTYREIFGYENSLEDYFHIGIYRYDSEIKKMVPVFRKADKNVIISDRSWDLDKGAIGFCSTRCKTFLHGDLATSGIPIDDERQYDPIQYRSAVVVPIHPIFKDIKESPTGKVCKGVVILTSGHPYQFTDDHANRMEPFGDIMSILFKFWGD